MFFVSPIKSYQIDFEGFDSKLTICNKRDGYTYDFGLLLVQVLTVSLFLNQVTMCNPDDNNNLIP